MDDTQFTNIENFQGLDMDNSLYLIGENNLKQSKKEENNPQKLEKDSKSF